MKVEIEVPTFNLQRALGGARIGYWGVALDWDPESLALTVADSEGDGATYRVIRDMWPTALKLMARQFSRDFSRLIVGDYDETTGDLLIQLAIFGEEKYA